MINLTYNGRLLLLRPAALGKTFEGDCTVTVSQSQAPSPENHWKRSQVQVPCPMYWYDKDPVSNEEVFITYAGYAPRIIKGLEKLGVDIAYDDRRPCGLPEPTLGILKGIEWRYRQAEVFAGLLGQRGGIIKCPTGYGKSFLIRQLSRVYPESKIVVTVTSLDVAKTLFEELRLTIPDLGFCGTGGQHPGRVTVAVSKSLENCPRDANIVLCDEAHTLCTPSYIKLLNRFSRAKMFGFTATPTGRSDNADGFLEAIFGPIISDVSYQEGVAHGNIVQIDARIFRSPVGPDVSGISNKAMADRMGIIRNNDRNNLVIRATKELEEELGSEAQILVMVDKIEHAYILAQALPEYTVVTGVMPKERVEELLANGAMTKEQALCTAKDREKHRTAFEANELKRVICTRVWEKGVDFRDLQGLVRADGLASPIAAGQIPGRLSRLSRTVEKSSGILVDFYDSYSKNLLSRSKARLREYKGNGWSITYKD